MRGKIKEERLKAAKDFLEAYNIPYEVHNNGFQFNLQFGQGETVSFYPTTNRWVHRGRTYYGDVAQLWDWVGAKEEREEVRG